jgi:hypothetical protein
VCILRSQDWVAKLQQARQAGHIVDVPKATLNGGLADYPDGLVMDERVCSYRRSSCIAPDDISQGPPATWAINYDDGCAVALGPLCTVEEREQTVAAVGRLASLPRRAA